MIPPELMTTLLTGGHALLLIGVVILYLQQRAGGRAHDELKSDVGGLRTDLTDLKSQVSEVTGELRVLRPIVERRMQARPSTGD